MHEAPDFGRNPNLFWIMKTRLTRILSVYVLALGLLGGCSGNSSPVEVSYDEAAKTDLERQPAQVETLDDYLAELARRSKAVLLGTTSGSQGSDDIERVGML